MQRFFKIIAVLYCLLAPLQLVNIANLSDPASFFKTEISIILSLLLTELVLFSYQKFENKSSVSNGLILFITIFIAIVTISFAHQISGSYTSWTLIIYNLFRFLKYLQKDLEILKILALSSLCYLQFSVLHTITPIAVALSIMFASFAYPLLFQDYQPTRFRHIIRIVPAIISNFLIALNLLSLIFLLITIPTIVSINIKEFNRKSFLVYSSLIFLIMIIIAVLSLR